jgi:hypothetical protein
LGLLSFGEERTLSLDGSGGARWYQPDFGVGRGQLWSAAAANDELAIDLDILFAAPFEVVRVFKNDISDLRLSMANRRASEQSRTGWL